MTTAAEVLRAAADIVSGPRAQQHGDMFDCHSAIAGMWNAYLAIRREPAQPLTALDVAQMLLLFKVARAQTGLVSHADHYLDQAGYAGCSAEIAARTVVEQKQNN